MTGSNPQPSAIQKPSAIQTDRQIIRVRAPTAQAAIGEALRRAFVLPAPLNADRELSNLLERI